MNVHEYQAKALFKEFGLPVLRGGPANSVEQALDTARGLQREGVQSFVVKAQIHAGGRGKAGGIKLASSLEELEQAVESILGRPLATAQTGPEGQLVRTVLVEESCQIDHEFYLGITLDRQLGQVTMMASREGGVDIEKAAQKGPEVMVKLPIVPSVGASPYMGRKLAYGIGLKGQGDKKAAERVSLFFRDLYRLYVALDCTLAEINPLALTPSQEIVALDAKLSFDDNALFRHPRLLELRDPHEESPQELEAKVHGASYVALEGNIGCLVNGAGLAMATMDIIKLYGGAPANFLDVGGSADQKTVEKAFSLILSDPKVQVILVNIFGGIMRCDIIADGLVATARSMNVTGPIVVRLEGTNAALGKKILTESGLKMIPAQGLEDAAKKAVECLSQEGPAL